MDQPGLRLPTDQRDDDFYHDRHPDFMLDQSADEEDSSVGCWGRVKNDMDNFNVRGNNCATFFLLIDCFLQNFMLYLIWFEFIQEPNAIDEPDGKTAFVSQPQRRVFIGYMVLYTMLTVLPGLVSVLAYYKTAPYRSGLTKFIAKTLLVALSFFGLH